jgi:hypothetical protein
MKWTYGIKNKTTAALLLAFILGLTLLTNLLERNRFKRLEKSFSSMYEDRLMAENYLFHLYENLKNREDLLENVGTQGINETMSQQLDQFRAQRSELVAKYSATYLTEEETKEFNTLNQELSLINQLEQTISSQQPNTSVPSPLLRQHDEVTAQAFATLSALNDIQPKEGALLRNQSEKIFLGSVFTSHFEMVVLIAIGIIIQALIFSARTMQPVSRQQQQWN